MTIARAIEILDPEHQENYDGMDEVNEACRMGMEALERMRWIPCSERMPDENNRWILCLCVSGAMEVLKIDYTMWNWDAQYPGRCYMENYVTHWMPLPEPPEEEQSTAKKRMARKELPKDEKN